MQVAEHLNKEREQPEYIWSRSLRRAADRIECAIRGDSPVIMVLGAPGSGRTRLVEEVMQTRLRDFSVAFVTRPGVLDADVSGTIGMTLDQLRQTSPDDGGHAPVVIVDDSELLLWTTVTRLVDYTQEKRNGRSSLKLVLVAEPTFGDIVEMLPPDIGVASFTIAPLPMAEAEVFLKAKQREFGLEPDALSADEFHRILERSKGYPGHMTTSLKLIAERDIEQALVPLSKSETGLLPTASKEEVAGAQEQAEQKHRRQRTWLRWRT